MKMDIDKDFVILFRKDLDTEQEFKICKDYFSVIENRALAYDQIVIPRYSALPFYKELEEDLKIQMCPMINTYQQHKYIADFEYYWDIKDFTPKTYFELSDIPSTGSFVVKGKTNSRKHYWNQMMFAENKRRAIEIACDLRLDSMIGQQDIIVRNYIPLKTLEEGINGLPFSDEWRFFCYKNKMLSYGYYWTNISPELKPKLSCDDSAFDLVYQVMERVRDKVNFFVVDVAKTQEDKWIVIEMNDGQMSGLSENDPDILYNNLYFELENDIDFWSKKL